MQRKWRWNLAVMQALHIDLALTGDENRYEVRSWYVYDSGNYEIDDFMPVWDGK